MRSLPDALPSVLNIHQVCLFNFYLDGLVKQGMRHGTNLYGAAYTFAAEDRLNAFDFASQLAAPGCQTVITVSKQEYQVWVRLQADEYPHWQSIVDGALRFSLKHQLSPFAPNPNGVAMNQPMAS